MGKRVKQVNTERKMTTWNIVALVLRGLFYVAASVGVWMLTSNSLALASIIILWLFMESGVQAMRYHDRTVPEVKLG